LKEIGDRTTVFEFGGLRDRQRDYIDWALRTALSPGIEPDAVLTKDAAILLAAKLKTPLQIGRHLVRAFEAGFEASVKPIDAATVEGVLSRQIDDLEPQLTRHGYDTKSLADQFDAKPVEIRRLLRGGLDPASARELGHDDDADFVDDDVGQGRDGQFARGGQAPRMADLGEVLEPLGGGYDRAVYLLGRRRVVERDIVDDVIKIAGRRFRKDKSHLTLPAMLGSDAEKNFVSGNDTAFASGGDAVLDPLDLPGIRLQILLKGLHHNIVAGAVHSRRECVDFCDDLLLSADGDRFGRLVLRHV
jgi:hypothetical protein